jgi:uncharacterized protein YndB with AHSA1/START domain
MQIEPAAVHVEPVRRSVTVARPVAEAFAIFTERMSEWWPFRDHSIYDSRAKAVVFEPRPGGEVYELSVAGERCAWGQILNWEPPDRFVMTWHPGRDAGSAQELEVRFRAVGAGTLVEVEHRGWQRLAERAVETRGGYDTGWTTVLERYLEACAKPRP